MSSKNNLCDCNQGRFPCSCKANAPTDATHYGMATNNRTALWFKLSDDGLWARWDGFSWIEAEGQEARLADGTMIEMGVLVMRPNSYIVCSECRTRYAGERATICQGCHRPAFEAGVTCVGAGGGGGSKCSGATGGPGAASSFVGKADPVGAVSIGSQCENRPMTISVDSMAREAALDRDNTRLSKEIDDALDREAALRDEIGQVKGEYDRAVNKVDALREELANHDSASLLMNAWVTEHKSQMPWDKAIELIAVVTKMPDVEKQRLLCLDDQYELMQLRLTAAEQRNAEDLRDAERYRELRKFTPYRFKKMQDASVTDGGDVLYFHADKFDALMDAELTKPTESGASE